MKTLILYASKNGATKKCAEKISNGLNEKPNLTNYKGIKGQDISSYDVIALGTPVYAGTFNQEFKDFCLENEEILKSKKVFLFISCMDEAKIKEYISNNLPGDKAKMFEKIFYCGGAFYFSKMNWFEKFIIKKIANSQNKKTGKTEKVDGKTDIEMFNENNIKQIIDSINNQNC